MNLGTPLNVLFIIIKVKILVLIKCSYNPSPHFCWLFSLHTWCLFWCPFLDPHLTTYSPNIFIVVFDLGMCTLCKLGLPGDLLRGYWQVWVVCGHEICRFSLRISGKRRWSCWTTWFVAPDKHLRFHTWHRCATSFFLTSFLFGWWNSEQANRR